MLASRRSICRELQICNRITRSWQWMSPHCPCTLALGNQVQYHTVPAEHNHDLSLEIAKSALMGLCHNGVERGDDKAWLLHLDCIGISGVIHAGRFRMRSQPTCQNGVGLSGCARDDRVKRNTVPYLQNEHLCVSRQHSKAIGRIHGFGEARALLVKKDSELREKNKRRNET